MLSCLLLGQQLYKRMKAIIFSWSKGRMNELRTNTKWTLWSASAFDDMLLAVIYVLLHVFVTRPWKSSYRCLNWQPELYKRTSFCIVVFTFCLKWSRTTTNVAFKATLKACKRTLAVLFTAFKSHFFQSHWCVWGRKGIIEVYSLDLIAT